MCFRVASVLWYAIVLLLLLCCCDGNCFAVLLLYWYLSVWLCVRVLSLIGVLCRVFTTEKTVHAMYEKQRGQDTEVCGLTTHPGVLCCTMGSLLV